MIITIFIMVIIGNNCSKIGNWDWILVDSPYGHYFLIVELYMFSTRSSIPSFSSGHVHRGQDLARQLILKLLIVLLLLSWLELEFREVIWLKTDMAISWTSSADDSWLWCWFCGVWGEAVAGIGDNEAIEEDDEDDDEEEEDDEHDEEGDEDGHRFGTIWFWWSRTGVNWPKCGVNVIEATGTRSEERAWATGWLEDSLEIWIDDVLTGLPLASTWPKRILRTKHRRFSKCFFREFLNTNVLSQCSQRNVSLDVWQSMWRSNLSLVLDRWGHLVQAYGRFEWQAILCSLSSLWLEKPWLHTGQRSEAPRWIFRWRRRSYFVAKSTWHSLQLKISPVFELWIWRWWACSPLLVK